MSPHEFKAIREASGLSLSELASLLRIENIDNVRYMETGKKTVSGPVSVLMELLRDGRLDHRKPK